MSTPLKRPKRRWGWWMVLQHAILRPVSTRGGDTGVASVYQGEDVVVLVRGVASAGGGMLVLFAFEFLKNRKN